MFMELLSTGLRGTTERQLRGKFASTTRNFDFFPNRDRKKGRGSRYRDGGARHTAFGDTTISADLVGAALAVGKALACFANHYSGWRASYFSD